MSNLTCPECGSSNISTERRPDGFHHCIDCRHHWKIGASQPKPSLFDRITQSPEVLAERLVYSVALDYCYEEWYSTLFPDKDFSTKSEAIAATVAKLNEVENNR